MSPSSRGLVVALVLATSSCSVALVKTRTFHGVSCTESRLAPYTDLLLAAAFLGLTAAYAEGSMPAAAYSVPAGLGGSGLLGWWWTGNCRDHLATASPEMLAERDRREAADAEARAAWMRSQRDGGGAVGGGAGGNDDGGGGAVGGGVVGGDGSGGSSSGGWSPTVTVERKTVPWGRSCRQGSDACAPGGCFDLGGGRGAICTSLCDGDGECPSGYRCDFETRVDPNGHVLRSGMKLCRP